MKKDEKFLSEKISWARANPTVIQNCGARAGHDPHFHIPLVYNLVCSLAPSPKQIDRREGDQI